MIEVIIWFAAFFCPNPTHTAENHGNCNLIHMTTASTTSEGDTGGETGGTPPPTVPPPPPPPPTGY